MMFRGTVARPVASVRRSAAAPSRSTSSRPASRVAAPQRVQIVSRRTYSTKTESMTHFCKAAAAGDIETVKSILSKGIDVNAGNYDMRTPLHLAAAEGRLDVVQYLIENGKAQINPVDRWGGTPLQDAVRHGHESVAKYLRSKGGLILISKQDQGAELCKAAAAGDIETIKKMIESGVDVNQGDYDNRTALHLACSEGQVETVKFLIAQGANVNAVDRFGGTPLKEAAVQNTAAHQEITDLLNKAGAGVEKNLLKLQQEPEFLSSIKKSLPLLSEKGHFEYSEAWIPSLEDGTISCSEAWYSTTADVNKITPMRKASEQLKSTVNENTLAVQAYKKKAPVFTNEITAENMGSRFEAAKTSGIRNALAVPIVYNDSVLAVLNFFDIDGNHVAPEAIQNFGSFAQRLVVSTLQSINAKIATQSEVASIHQEQMNAVYNLIVKEGVFNASTIYQEVNWWYQGLGLVPYYFEHFTPAQIAKHIHSFIAAKKVAQTSGNKEDIRLVMEQEKSAFYLCPSTTAQMVEIEKQLENYVGKYMKNHPGESISVSFFRSKGPAVPYGNEHLGIYMVDFNNFVQQPSHALEHETDIWKVATGVFLRDKAKDVRERYQTILTEAVSKNGPVVKMFEPNKDGTIPMMFAFHADSTSHKYMSVLTDLLAFNGMTGERKFVETFANGIIVYSIYLRPGAEMKKYQEVLDQASLLFHIPENALSPLFLNGQINVHEYAYAVSVWRFCYYFLTRKTEEYQGLKESLKSDPVNLNRLKNLQANLRKDIVTEDRIALCFNRYPEIIKRLYADFHAITHPSVGKKPAINSDLLTYIKKNVSSDLDQNILTACATFNASVMKTNFHNKEKAAICFRLDPQVFMKDGDWPDIPYGIFLVMSNNFRAFHVRFRDIARGGIRIIKSGNPQAYAKNAESLFQENFGLAFTQQKKNKDIPEGGSKGTILLNPENQADTEIAFRKYVDALLDLLLPPPGQVDHLGKTEILFLGPDENTAELMDWACLYAKKRGASFWKAFTTGKSQKLGGIPHDIYGMTTRSVHRYVVNTLEKLGISEETQTKLQTGGPDGDLGSNEILISKDKTIGIVDGSGVAFDPEGLDRTELTRLAKARKMIRHMDKSKLGKNGFVVTIDEKDVKLPNGEVVESGLVFRNEFHLHPLATADLFVPCGGRPESINANNVSRAFKPDGTPKWKIISEGANLFITQDARLTLEKAGVILFKDASANKGGVTSSSHEVFAALAFDDATFQECMTMKEDGTLPESYKQYVNEIITRIEENANLEWGCIWREHERTGLPSCVLTDLLSAKINVFKDFVQKSNLWADKELRTRLLQAAVPKFLQEKIGLENIIKRVPENYLKAVFGAYIGSRYVYTNGIESSEFAFFEFMNKILAHN